MIFNKDFILHDRESIPTNVNNKFSSSLLFINSLLSSANKNVLENIVKKENMRKMMKMV